MYANQSLCWLRMRHGDLALEDWSKAWYREGAALSFMKVQLLVSILPSQSNSSSLLVYTSLCTLVVLILSHCAQNYVGAADAFREALQLDPKSEEIKEALR
jgi:hypothetical protein